MKYGVFGQTVRLAVFVLAVFAHPLALRAIDMLGPALPSLGGPADDAEDAPDETGDVAANDAAAEAEPSAAEAGEEAASVDNSVGSGSDGSGLEGSDPQQLAEETPPAALPKSTRTPRPTIPAAGRRPNPVRLEAAGEGNEPRNFATPAARQSSPSPKATRKQVAPARITPPAASVEQTIPTPPLGVDGSASGDAIVEKAIALSKSARSEEIHNEIIHFCEQAKTAGLESYTDEYVDRLMAWSHNRRGELRSDMGRDDDALADFDAAVTTDASAWRAWHNRGVTHAKLGRYEEAIEDFDQTIRINPRFANAYFNRGELRYEMDEYSSAIQDYDAALKITPRDSAALNSRGHAYYRLDQFEEAIRDYTAAIRFEPKNAAAYTNRGDAHADRGAYAMASRDYQMAMKLDPQLSRAWQSAAWLMATCPQKQFRNPQLALQAAVKAIQIEGAEDHLYLETLAAAQAIAGEFQQAQETQSRAMALAPSEEIARYEACLQLYQQNQPFLEAPKGPPTKVAAPEARAKHSGNRGDRQAQRQAITPGFKKF